MKVRLLNKVMLPMGIACCAGAICPAAAASDPQVFPEKPIRLVVPFAPGGGTDTMIRLLTPKAAAVLGKPIIIENKAGASSMIGTDSVVRSKPDGYTLLAVDSSIIINPGLFKDRIAYDTLKSLQGVTMLATAPVLFAGKADLPANDLKEIIALSQKGPLSYGSGGTGTSVHLAAEMFQLVANVKFTHIPYKGVSPATADVLGGHIDTVFSGLSSVGEYVKTGRLKAYAITGNTRLPVAPTVPTFAELGYDVDASTYWGIYAPSGVPYSVREKVSKAFSQALEDSSTKSRLMELGFSTIGSNPDEHDIQFTKLVEQWSDVINRIDLKVE